MESHFNIDGTKPEENNIFFDKKSGKRFRLFKYFDHEVIQDVETGWINAGTFVRNVNPCKNINHFYATDDYENALKIGVKIITSNNDSENRAVEKLKDVHQYIFKCYIKGYGKRIRGTFAPFKVFQLIALWADSEHKIEVLDLLEQINTYANLINRSAYEIINILNDQLKEEITKLKQENSHLEDQLLEQTLNKEFLSYDNHKLQLQVHDLTTPKNKLIPTYLYAKKYGDYFHLKYKQINPHLIKGNIKQLSMINTKDVKIDFMYYGKKLNLLENIGGKWLCRMSDIDLIFEILDKLKDNTFDLNEYQDTNVLIHEELTKLKALPKTPQRNGKIFELEYCLNRDLTPWEFIPSSVLNRYHEIHLDTGIDFVQISNGNINGIGQVKVKAGSYLNRSDIETFISKCQNKIFQSMKKSIILKNTKIGKKLKAHLNELGVDVIML